MKHKAKLLLTALTALFILSGSLAYAEQALKVGIVDFARCIDESKTGRMRKEELRAKTEQMDERQKALQEEGRAIAEEVKAQQMLLSDTLKAEKARRFDEIRAELQSIQKEKLRISDELTKVVMGDIQKVVLEIVQEGEYDMILTDGGPWLLYFTSTLDITDKVIAALDKSQP